MKIYAVYARLELIDKPSWLEGYRAKYNNLYDYHVTLKQPAYIEETELSDIQRLLADVFDNFTVSNGNIRLVFDEVIADKDDGSIMIMAQPNQKLVDLQKTIRERLANYSQYMKPELKDYEEQFAPHITVAFHLGERFDEAVSDLDAEATCIGEIHEVVLSCVKEITIAEAKNPANMTIYNLHKYLS